MVICVLPLSVAGNGDSGRGGSAEFGGWELGQKAAEQPEVQLPNYELTQPITPIALDNFF
jgi:hypothetical protein